VWDSALRIKCSNKLRQLTTRVELDGGGYEFLVEAFIGLGISRLRFGGSQGDDF
jgi:hypothetical protein